MRPPKISVIVPTYNRCDLLRQTLDSLAAQRFPAGEFEVIVSDDGSSDGTAEMVRLFPGPLRLRYCCQDDRGYRASAARNAAARLAASPVLAFLDTGTVAGPDFVRGHLQPHLAGSGKHAVVGYCYGYRLDEDAAWLTAALAESEPEQVVHRYRDDPAFADLRHGEFEKAGFDLGRLHAPWYLLWSMNFSVSGEAFSGVGGFDESLTGWGGEDRELGYRLLHSGVRFLLSREAWTIELPHERRVAANLHSHKRNSLQILRKHCEPTMELVCAADLRNEIFRIEQDSAVLRAWAQQAAGLDVLTEISDAAARLAPGASVAIFGCGSAVPSSLPPCVLFDFDERQLAAALAGGRHTGHQLIGLRTPLPAGSVDLVIITSRLSGVWDRWGRRVLAEARRIGREVRGPVVA